MSWELIVQDWKKNKFKPVYWLEGEEPYFIDKLVDYAEKQLLTESEAGFNLTIFYGKDADWAQVYNACKRYPMFAEKQVVILKEAQHMRDINQLEAYIEHPLLSTIFVVAYKEKKLDGRSKLAKLVKQQAVVLSTKKLYDNQVPDWAANMVKNLGFTITNKGLVMLVDHIGNDLSRMENEVEKLAMNLGARKAITEEDVEQFIGISKEFNVFEFQAAMAKKDMAQCLRILQYFEQNPKAAPIQLVLPALFNFFSKLYVYHSLLAKDEKSVAVALGVQPFFVRDYIRAAEKFGPAQTEQVLLLLQRYNMRAVGVQNGSANDASLMKELVVKIIQ
ncbi:MAG: DNA polymerase III subunit delta [Sphingobacteriia bacterium]|nr:MAG: DNA polymerase III subunit delta [Sphingobacteriia bacterium]